MFVPMWVVWLVVALIAAPILYFAAWFLFVSIALGKEAERNAMKRRDEALSVISCPACRPLLPLGACERHRWHTLPPEEWVTAEALEVWDCSACGPVTEKIPCDKHRGQAKPLTRWTARPAPVAWLRSP